MINIEFNPKTYTVDINGHAEHGEKGEDIVCSAISVLFYTLAHSLYDFQDKTENGIDFSDEDGNGHISCTPKKEYEQNIIHIYYTILHGFELVAENYKENVNFSILGM
jgi:uncharacterized protein YsxB (DUF464 family)